MSRFLSYSPEQVFLLPPNVKQVLGEDHLCFFVHEVVERLDMKPFLDAYSEEGGQMYHPSLMLKVWLYAYMLGLTSARRLEQRVREDLGFRYLAGGGQPDFWALNAFRRCHKRGINDAFVQVLEMAQKLGLVRMGAVAIDSTRVKASASPDRMENMEQQRQERARKRRKVRRWQQACDGDNPQEGAGMSVGGGCAELQQADLAKHLEPLPKMGKRSRTDPDSRFLRERGGRFVLGYTGEIAVSEDHFIVAARVTQNAHDVHALLPMVDEVERRWRQRPQRVLADSGFYSNQNIAELQARGIDAYMPDSNVAHELRTGTPATGVGCKQNNPHLLAMRQKLRTPEGQRCYGQRKMMVEPVFGVLKEQRGMRKFRLRSLEKVNIEWTWAALAYNLGRLHAKH